MAREAKEPVSPSFPYCDVVGTEFAERPSEVGAVVTSIPGGPRREMRGISLRNSHKRRSGMRRPILLLAAAAFLAAVPLSHLATAQRGQDRRPPKVTVCHIEELSEDGETLMGTVISISSRALPAHCRHGDHNATEGAEVGDPCSRGVEDVLQCGEDDSVLPPWYEAPPEEPPADSGT